MKWTQVVDLYVQSVVQNKFTNTVKIKKYFKNLLTKLNNCITNIDYHQTKM